MYQLFKNLLFAKHTLVILFFLSTILSSTMAQAPKREFRGAWIQCVNGQFQGIGTKKMQQTLSYQLDELQKDGVNAIIFQVRPECDALYESKIEPWSKFLSGQQGVAPSPYWDPLQWMIDECHKRGMELHAWINPYKDQGHHVVGKEPYRCDPSREGVLLRRTLHPESWTQGE